MYLPALFGRDGYFLRGTHLAVGMFDDRRFLAHAMSGGQNLWLPHEIRTGIKLLHPHGQSGTPRKANSYFKAQTILAEEGLAPEPLEMYEVNLTNKAYDSKTLSCYGIMMERIMNGGLDQVLENFGLFGLQMTRRRVTSIATFLLWHGPDAVTFADYLMLARFFTGAEYTLTLRPEEQLAEKKLNAVRTKIPSVLHDLDFTSWKNIAFDQTGELKIVDCDESGL